MTTRMHDPFTPHGDPSRETLLAYAEGRLDPVAAHAVELHLEADPLLRDAMDGLQRPGALQGLDTLRSHAPKGFGSSLAPWSLSAVIIAVISGSVYLLTIGDRLDTSASTAIAAPVITTAETAPDTAIIPVAEIAAAVEIPESLHIGHASTERHSIAHAGTATTVTHPPVERIDVEPVRPKSIPAVMGPEHHGPAVEQHRRPSLQLIYLHDLKLLHPKEMYGRSPDIGRLTTSVDARFATAAEQRAAHGDERRIAYLAFMDEALERFVHNDHKGCLDELSFVLSQYPDDVNALFYAGLCCYNLGMNHRAERFLGRAATHTFKVFDEEAEWYHALALERSGRHDTARLEFERIARSTSFYADRAQAKTGGH